ncbi:hypothetical protein WJX81_003222 [Elliptochloris bilobata]|uniref:Sucrose phosphatase-like domain-containing protein n=1 Tax=Elliptochloris bilobata TaxID=381761 RepID=A0AAW1RMQ9_9CHLO
MAPGTYQYKYRVNGEWATSPCEPITGDGSGCFNNQRLVAPSAAFAWQARWGGTEVFVTGDWCAWAELIPLRRDAATQDFGLACSLAPGVYCYQYLVDGTWMTSPDVPVGPDDDGHLCNKIRVEDPPAFHLFYATGWRDAVLRVQTLDADGTPQTPGWREVPMFTTPSRATPLGGAWLSAVVPATGDPARGPPQLEFTVANGDGSAEDRPALGRTYLCRAPGGFKLLSGRLRPFPRARAASTMLVSDLDGTMVGDGAEADAATQRFCNYWEDTAALAGSVLVYNTGRSLGQFTALWAEKGGALALPDVLITAVGTKIFLLDTQEKGRWAAGGSVWKEDLQWAQRLSEGWDLGRVRQVAQGVLERLGEGAAAWLDRGTEHPHRVALSVRGDCLAGAVEQLRAGFEAANVQVRIITSGTGGWRYVDCVSIRGGKLEALEYVRMLFSVPRERCVAAGDSGNDILMLEGANPAIVVGNAQPLLVDWLAGQEQDARVVLTDAAMADGILEGLARLGLY